MAKRKNSMDDIVIRYGRPQLSSSEISKKVTFKMLLERKSREQAKKEVDAEVKEVSLPEFLKIKKEMLSPDEQKVQEALKAIYELNDSSVPIYHHFPKREKPLVIDTTCLCPARGAVGAYSPDDHKIDLAKIGEINPTRLIDVLAHELKHAQQHMTDRTAFNNYQQHQLNFLGEVQAYACADRVLASLCPEDPKARSFNKFRAMLTIFGEILEGHDNDMKAMNDWILKDIEERWTAISLKSFLTDERCRKMYESYKDTYDGNLPIHKNDTPLTEIPPEFDITQPARILEVLANFVPKQARTMDNKVKQAIVNDDKKALLILLKEKDTQGKFLIGDEYICGIGLDVLIHSEKTNTTEIFETFLKSGRCSPEDVESLFSSTFHLPEGKELTDEFVQLRMKLLNILISQKTPNGKNIISKEQAEKEIDLAKQSVNASHNPEDERKLIALAEKAIHLPKQTMKKTLKKKQISPKKKTSSKVVRKTPSHPEI